MMPILYFGQGHHITGLLELQYEFAIRTFQQFDREGNCIKLTYYLPLIHRTAIILAF